MGKSPLVFFRFYFLAFALLCGTFRALDSGGIDARGNSTAGPMYGGR